MNAEGTSLAHNTIQKDRGILCDAIVFHEEFLELVDNQEGSRHRFTSARLLVASHVLHPQLAEHVPPPLQFLVHPLEHAQAELPVTLDRHHPRMRQTRRRVAFEFHPLLEIHQVELHLVGAAPEREIRNDHMKERRLTRSRFPRK